MNSFEKLTTKYPDARIVAVRQELDETDFADQKHKQQEYPIEGGAIGIVWVSASEVVLTQRTRPHKGWALPGGRVEVGEEFDAAFLREVEEETSVKATIRRLLVVEKKVFVSPSGEELPITLVVFESEAKLNQRAVVTEEARLEGLHVATFSINSLPDNMVLKDREKLDIAIAQRFA